jgi:hypothetical protein
VKQGERPEPRAWATTPAKSNAISTFWKEILKSGFGEEVILLASYTGVSPALSASLVVFIILAVSLVSLAIVMQATEVILGNPLGHLLAYFDAVLVRRAEVHAAIDSGLNDLLDNLVGAGEVPRRPWIRNCAGELNCDFLGVKKTSGFPPTFRCFQRALTDIPDEVE